MRASLLAVTLLLAGCSGGWKPPSRLEMKNRMIDFAASAAAGSCEQCFQMLEAARPIPLIAGH